MESNTAIKSRQLSKDQESKSQEELPNQKLPYELLLILFSYFRVLDLVNVQQVCSGWRVAARDKTLWKNFTLTLLGTSEDERKIMIMPAVRSIAGKANNDLVNLILENIIELNKLNVNFDPPLSSSQLQSVLDKYPNLDSISLSMGAPDILKCLETVKNSEYLMEISFYIHYSCQYIECYRMESILLDIYKVFNGGKNFRALKKTNLLRSPFGSKLSDHSFMRSAVTSFISERSEQLLSLEMETFPEVDMRQTVSKCTKLQELDLIYCNNPADLMIAEMTELKSLSLNLTCIYEWDDLSALQNYFRGGSWDYLTKVQFAIQMCHDPTKKDGTLNVIIKNVKQLEDLCYEDWEDHANESELCDIGSLPKLVNLSVSGLQSISDVGMSYVSNCPKLNSLTLIASTSCSDNMDDCVCNTLHKLTNLEKFMLYVPIHEHLRKININLTDKEKIKMFRAS